MEELSKKLLKFIWQLICLGVFVWAFLGGSQLMTILDPQKALGWWLLALIIMLFGLFGLWGWLINLELGWLIVSLLLLAAFLAACITLPPGFPVALLPLLVLGVPIVIRLVAGLKK
jgi:hypothetical protein